MKRFAGRPSFAAFIHALRLPALYLLLRLIVLRGCFYILLVSGEKGLSAELARNRAALRYEALLPLLNLLCALLFCLFLWQCYRPLFTKLRAAPFPAARLPDIVLLGVSLNVFVSLFVSLLPFGGGTGRGGDALSLLWGLLYIALAAPFVEELIFRGYCYGCLRRGFSPAAALTLQALLFGLLHLDALQFVYAVPAGLIFGFVYLRRSSLSAVFWLHAAFNLGGLLPLPVPGHTLLRALLLVPAAALVLWPLRRVLR